MQVLDMPRLIRGELVKHGPLTLAALGEGQVFTHRGVTMDLLSGAVDWMVGNRLLERIDGRLLLIHPAPIHSPTGMDRFQEHVLDIIACTCAHIETDEINRLIHQQGIVLQDYSLSPEVAVLNALDHLHRQALIMPRGKVIAFFQTFDNNGLPSGHREVPNRGEGPWFATIAGLQQRLIMAKRRQT